MSDTPDPDMDRLVQEPEELPDPATTQAEDRRMVVAFTFTHHVAPVHIDGVLKRIERELGHMLGDSARVVAHAYTEGPDGRSVGSRNGTMTVVELLRGAQALEAGAGG